MTVGPQPNDGVAGESLDVAWPDLITDLLVRRDLSPEQARWAMNEVMSGAASPIALAGFLVALAAKGETVGELRALADEMVAHAVEVQIPDSLPPLRIVDIVGTGGDRHHTVNISTMASLVVAGAGLPVAKHGNRAASSASGSADVLEALGIKLDVDSVSAGELLADVGITFLFAQQFHPAFRHAAAARVGLGIPTAFNVLGPITNPARPHAGAIGVGNRRMAPLIAGVFADRGNSTLVFRSQDGLDELATTSPAEIWEVTEQTEGVVKHHVVDFVQELGLPPATIADLRGGSPEVNADVARALLDGRTGPIRDSVLLNAAAAIVADGSLIEVTEDGLMARIRAAFDIAAESIDSGRARDVLDRWVERSHR